MSQPDFNIAVENPFADDDEDNSLTKVGALWSNDSDSAKYTGEITLMGIPLRVVLFKNDGGDE